MRPRTRRMFLVPLIVVVGVYACICLYLYFFQNRFLFYPTPDLVVAPDQAGMAYTDQYFELPDGEKMHSWYLPGDSSKPTVLFLHGNGGNISHRMGHLTLLHSLGVSILIIDYRGYGRSTGKPSEEHLYEDARTAYNWLVESKGVPASRIFIFGESIGGAVAIDLASQVPVAGLIVESSFTTLKEVADLTFPFVPTSILLRSDFNSSDKLKRVTVPILICHSPDDDIIPYSLGRKLFDAANPPKGFLRIQGGHNDREYLAVHQYTQAMGTFFDTPLAVGDLTP